MKIIGIDPGSTNTGSGVAFMEDGEYTKLVSMSIVDLTRLIDLHCMDCQTLFVLEDLFINKPRFNRASVQSPGAKDRNSQNIGMVKGYARVIEEFLMNNSCNYVKVKPLVGAAKLAKSGKHAREVFRQYTGWSGSSNKDTRDAAMLIHRAKGKKFKSAYDARELYEPAGG